MSERTQLYPSGFTHLSVSTAVSGSNTLVAATANKSTKVYRVILVAAGAVTVQFFDGVTALTGAMSMATGVPLVLEFDGQPLFTGSVNTAFNITLGGAVQVSGAIDYELTYVSNE